MKFLPLVGALLLAVAGCRNAQEENSAELLKSEAVNEARRLINAGQAECVLVKNGKILYMERGRGVSPLLSLYDRHGKDFRGVVVVDKVIGRAAAAIVIAGGAQAVHGEVMSEDAAAWLRRQHIRPGCQTLVPRILNRKRDGLCPLEKAVAPYDDPTEAVAALRRKVTELQQKAAAFKK